MARKKREPEVQIEGYASDIVLTEEQILEIVAEKLGERGYIVVGVEFEKPSEGIYIHCSTILPKTIFVKQETSISDGENQQTRPDSVRSAENHPGDDGSRS